MSKSPRKITVVTEDAYKQNTVYRPWHEIIANRAPATVAKRSERNRASFVGPVHTLR